MINASSSSFRLLQFPTVLFCILLIVAATLLSAHSEKGNESGEAPGVHASAVSIDTAVNWDSIYSLINSGFETLAPVMRKGCLDCHSDKTRYPWYHQLPIVKGIIDEDIRDARKHLDMSNGFPFKGHGKPADDLAAIKEEISEGAMPPALYRLLHWSAKPNKAEADSIISWVDRSLNMMAAHGVRPSEE